MPKKLFQPGNKAARVNRGKSKDTGRTLALLTLDGVLKKEGNRKVLEAALERMLRQNPASFFKQIVVPLIPKTALERLEADAAAARAMGERQRFIYEASVLICRELEATGEERLAEALCRSLNAMADKESVTEVVLEVGGSTLG